MEKYRVRRGLWGKCVLQYFETFPSSLPNAPDPQWVDVGYKQAPRALVSEFDVINKIRDLEIDVGILEKKECEG
jgi:hypothetical protein